LPKPKIKTKREQVYDLLKVNPLTNYEIADELEMPLSSVCARCQRITRVKFSNRLWFKTRN
jgi:hypothetical protein